MTVTGTVTDTVSAGVAALRADGVATFSAASWGLGAALSGGLDERIMRLLSTVQSSAATPRGRPVAIHDGPISGIERLLSLLTPRLMALANEYLGDDAALVGCCRALRLAAEDLRVGAHDIDAYPAGAWHHDRCGRRLKAFVFLSDVTEEAHPTRVAIGSHRTFYYAHDALRLSRFSDTFINSSFATRAMTGGKFGGFVLDTNAVHKATLRGSTQRDVLVFELNARSKSEQLVDAPCGHATPLGTLGKGLNLTRAEQADLVASWLAAKRRAGRRPL